VSKLVPVWSVVLAASALVELLLDASAAVVQGVAGQADDVERVHHGDRVRESVLGRGLEPGEPVHRDDLDALLPGLGAGLQPRLERRFRAALDHVQQPRGTRLVPGRRQIDDHGDVLVTAPGMAPHMLVHPDHTDVVEACLVVDQHASALGQDRFVRRAPGDAQPGRDPRDGEVVDDQGLQCPPDPAMGELRPFGCGRGGVFPPPGSAVLAVVAADPQQQSRGPVAERLVRQGPRDRAARRSSSAAAAAPRIRDGQATLEHSAIGRDALPDSDQAEIVQAGESRQIRGREGSVGHVEVFQMASVRTSIIGRPRRLSRHRRAHPVTRTYTLRCEEPCRLFTDDGVARF